MPRVQNFNRMLGVIFPFVEENVAESSANDGAGGHPNQEHAEPAFGRAFAFEHTAHNQHSEPKADGKHQTVPADLQRPSKCYGVEVPSNEI